MKKLSIVFIIISAVLCVYAADPVKPLKKAHEGFVCTDCHNETNPTVSTGVSCDGCHGTAQEVAALTADRYEKYYNPHDPLHYGATALCENCHREHAPSKLECNNPNCHGEFKYIVP